MYFSLKKPQILPYISVKAAMEQSLRINITYVDNSTQNFDIKTENSYQLKVLLTEKKESHRKYFV